MLTILKRSNWLLVICLILAIGCQTEKEDSIRTSEKITVRENALHFDSKQTFEATIGELYRNQKNLEGFEKKYVGYTSMRSAFDQLSRADFEKISLEGEGNFANILSIVGEGEEREIIRNTEDDILATLISKDGILFIGKDAYKIMYDQLIKVENIGESKINLRNISKGDLFKLKNESDVVISAVTHSKRIISIKSGAGNRDETCYQNYRQGGNKNRLKGEIWTTNVGPFYASVGARTRHQQRILGAWVRDKVPQIRLQIIGQILQTETGPPVTTNINEDTGILYNDSGDTNTFEFCVSAQCKFTINYMTTYHWAVCDDYVERSCSVSW